MTLRRLSFHQLRKSLSNGLPGSFFTQLSISLCYLYPLDRIRSDMRWMTTLQGKMIGGRPLVVIRLKDREEARRCQIVFVSSSEVAQLVEIIASLRGANVLLVGEANGFVASGGTIQFMIEDNRVRFTINLDAANRAGLIFSSKLLSLSKVVHDQRHS